MNPFRQNPAAAAASAAFYRKYYNDHNIRLAILGINPGRFGGGVTGVPFTDPKRLSARCGIDAAGLPAAREPSSEFVYDVVAAYGGEEKFFSKWSLDSLCPLGFVKQNAAGRPVNYNYYDDKELQAAAAPFIEKTLSERLDMGFSREGCVCLGQGKNFAFLKKLNEKRGFFKKIIPLPHPRYIAQYKSGEKERHVAQYLEALKSLESLLD